MRIVYRKSSRTLVDAQATLLAFAQQLSVLSRPIGGGIHLPSVMVCFRASVVSGLFYGQWPPQAPQDFVLVIGGERRELRIWIGLSLLSTPIRVRQRVDFKQAGLPVIS